MKQEFDIDSLEVMEAAQRVILFTLERLCFDPERYFSSTELAQTMTQPHERDNETYKSFNQRYGALVNPPSNVEIVMSRLYEEGKIVRIKLGKSVGYRTKK